MIVNDIKLYNVVALFFVPEFRGEANWFMLINDACEA